MNHLTKMLFLSLLMVVGFGACKKAEENTAEIAKETITEMKAQTIDAAKAAAVATEQAAQDIAKAAEQIDTDISQDEDASKDK